MHVTGLANKAGVPAYVVRYYTQIGLLAPSRDSDNGYRQFSTKDVYRVRFIRRAKLLGFKLNDIRKILGDADAGQSPCKDVRQIIKQRAFENRARLRELNALQNRIETAIEVWETLPDRTPSHDSLCYLIDTVAELSGDIGDIELRNPARTAVS